MTQWLRFEHNGSQGFGTVLDGVISVYGGDMFSAAAPTGQTLSLESVEILTPCVPSKMICLWNNFAANAAKQNLSAPAEPLWFLKSPSAYLAHGKEIRRPASYSAAASFTKANLASSSARDAAMPPKRKRRGVSSDIPA